MLVDVLSQSTRIKMLAMFLTRVYRKAPFASDADRVAMLFKRYQELTATTAQRTGA